MIGWLLAGRGWPARLIDRAAGRALNTLIIEPYQKVGAPFPAFGTFAAGRHGHVRPFTFADEVALIAIGPLIAHRLPPALNANRPRSVFLNRAAPPFAAISRMIAE